MTALVLGAGMVLGGILTFSPHSEQQGVGGLLVTAVIAATAAITIWGAP